MKTFFDIPIESVNALTAEPAVKIMRAILRAECGYAKLSPSVLTISSRLTTPDGGIDAEINIPNDFTIPTDCFFQHGLTGFQIKSGTSFKPWTKSAIRSELLDSKGQLYPEVDRLLSRRGRYVLLCTGYDLTPKQRNDSQNQIAFVFRDLGINGYENLIEVLGAAQIVEFAERYPGIASQLVADPIQEAWLLEEWERDAHLANSFETSPEQEQIIKQIRRGLHGETKHIRILGEPGLGKTRIVLESVKDESIAPYVLYIPHGSQFGQTRLFRQLLKTGHSTPLVLVIDELPELEMADLWRHLKPRCGSLKIISLDHGRDETRDEEIERLRVPLLPDGTIKKILIDQVGESRELDRWIAICEGSPRVALAVGENLRANPDDILKPPSTVPIWERFLHGYGQRDDSASRQIDCVAQHLALFSRFGYESPVADEAKYIAEQIRKVDPTIGWGRFQEIVQILRSRRVLQGSRTIFFVPKALHIYLWKKFWVSYGQGFDFIETFTNMPVSLHAWFMNMFKYAGNATTDHVIDDILKPEGIFSQRTLLTSAKGSRFLSILAEANSAAVLRLLEATIGEWSDEELLAFKQERQNIVWTLEKIAVWPDLTVRALYLLSRLAVNENAEFSNNSTGILAGLFRIGPEAAATESSPEARLPALLRLLRSARDPERRLGLKIMQAALDTHGGGFRIVGPEYQGLRERARIWMPATYGEWGEAYRLYFQTLVDETHNWPTSLRPEVCNALLEAVQEQIRTPACMELAFQVLNALVDDSAMLPGKLNNFFWHWNEYWDDGKRPEVTKRLKSLERSYTRRNLASRFQRYIIDVEWLQWDESFRERHNKSKNRAKVLAKSLARRVARHPELLTQILHLLTPAKQAAALSFFGEQMAHNDEARVLLPSLIKITLEKKHEACLHGYLSAIHTSDTPLYRSTVKGFLSLQKTAWLGVTIALRFEYDDELFVQCLDALEKRWIDPQLFGMLRFGKTIESIPAERIKRLFHELNERDDKDAPVLLIELLASIPFDESSPFDSCFVFGLVSRSVPGKTRDTMRGYYWKKICEKLIEWDQAQTLPLLDVLLSEIGNNYELSYDHDVEPLASKLVQTDPSEAWKSVKTHLEEALPKWSHALLNWLKGGLLTFDEKTRRGAIVYLPVCEIIEWIEKDIEPRAVLLAHAVPGTLDEEDGGRLTRELLHRYGHLKSVQSAISCSFHSGGWTGPTSAYLKRKREKLRRWLAAGFESSVTQWVEKEIEYVDRNISIEEISEERELFD